MNSKLQRIYFPRRISSALYVPAISEKKLEKSLGLNPSILIPDLEDSIAENEKLTAMTNLINYLPKMKKAMAQQLTKVIPRVNSLGTKHFEREVLELTKKINLENIDGIHIPKVDSVEESQKIEDFLTRIESDQGLDKNSIKIFPNIESTRGLVFLKEILGIFKERTYLVGFGGDDFSYDIGVSRSEDDNELDFARKQFALTCLAFNCTPVDSPYVKYQDIKGLKKELNYLKRIGFKAKFAIHPNQVDVINESFEKPNQNQEKALEIVREYEKALKEGKGVISIRGEMIDMPVYKKAKFVLNNYLL